MSRSGKLTREEFRQRQELDAARKAGTAPAEVDVETGKDINPHIPQYISQAPWYLDTGAPTLKHQRSTLKKDFDNDWYHRGLVVDTKVTKFRKGACENCGAMTHKAKFCTERPRLRTAKQTGRDIKPDEVVEQFSLDWDSKRDRWNGYDPNDYAKQFEDWEKIDQYRKELRDKEIEQKLMGKQKRDSDDEDDDEDKNEDDGDKYADEADMAGQKVDLKTRTTVRNLRIREDTAKYLLNLDVNSAYYDPKTRAMHENPLPIGEDSKATFVGENFVRATGEAVAMNQMQVFAWQAYEKGQDVNLQADPTKVELLSKEFAQKRDTLKSNLREGILAKYGGEEHLQAPPKEMLFAQTEQYVEYSRTGQVIKGLEPAIPKSKYEEDVYPNNHTSVWGSYWEDGKWGYKCCGQFIKNSFCTGQAGFEARRKSQAHSAGRDM